jgi:TetR/AcrR family transcriptional regulator of autoinduction and epiphytic fitness
VPEVKGGRRQERARETRRRIIAAAQELFERQGYASTTIQEIAKQADVAWQTVYAVFKTKIAILSAVFDVAVAGDDEPVPIMQRPFVEEIAAAGDAREKTRILARHLRGTGSRTAAVLGVIESAAGTDPEIAELWRKLKTQRMYGMTAAARAFAAAGVLKPGLDVERAADLLWWHSGHWAYRALVLDRGWSPADYEAWLAETLYTQLMAPATA